MGVLVNACSELLVNRNRSVACNVSHHVLWQVVALMDRYVRSCCNLAVRGVSSFSSVLWPLSSAKARCSRLIFICLREEVRSFSKSIHARDKYFLVRARKCDPSAKAEMRTISISWISREIQNWWNCGLSTVSDKALCNHWGAGVNSYVGWFADSFPRFECSLLECCGLPSWFPPLRCFFLFRVRAMSFSRAGTCPWRGQRN